MSCISLTPDADHGSQDPGFSTNETYRDGRLLGIRSDGVQIRQLADCLTLRFAVRAEVVPFGNLLRMPGDKRRKIEWHTGNHEIGVRRGTHIMDAACPYAGHFKKAAPRMR
jgi:hypothetical protein